ncbi:MAG TPA: hypothetical protein VFZ70_11240 [Euzebyales bacterium]
MPDGVQFPLVDGRRSTQRTGRDIVASAAAAVDPGLAAQIRDEPSWRTAYPRHLRDLTETGATSPDAGLAIARAGLARLHSTFTHHDGHDVATAADAVRATPADRLRTRVVEGTGRPPEHLSVPYRGRELAGDDLLAAADDWVARGIVEPALRTALRDIVDHPEWLQLKGRSFGLLGAGAEMAPTEHLLRWGADVAAVDIPRDDVWRRLEAMATAGSGTLHAPAVDGATVPGADLTTDAPRVRAWLADLDHPLVLGNYAYADGETFARLSVAADAIMAALRDADHTHGVACLATPTDVFAVPIEVVVAARARARRLPARTLAPLVRTATLGRLLVPNHRTTMRTDDGVELGIADSLVLQQGPNYALAKRLQRWRALVTHADGAFGAVHVAPPTRTRSVMKNRVLAAAYEGASLFGVEIFAPGTSRALMAALLVHALQNHRHAGPPATPRPEHELTAPAAHGGLWHVTWETRTAFPLAIARGARALLPR